MIFLPNICSRTFKLTRIEVKSEFVWYFIIIPIYLQYGKSALHFAAARNADEAEDANEINRRVLSIFELLINHNADANSTDNVRVCRSLKVICN